jgi:hypothetical protein
VPPATAFRDAFGVSEVELEKELKRYVTQSLYQSTRVTFADKVAIDKDWTIDQPSEADGQAAYADLLYALRRPEDAAARAEGALKLTPDHARAQAVLARIRAAQGQEEAAATLLAGAVKAAGTPTTCRPTTSAAAARRRRTRRRSRRVRAQALRRDACHHARAVARRRTRPCRHGALVADDPAALVSAAAFRLSQRHEHAAPRPRPRPAVGGPARPGALVARARATGFARRRSC